MTASAMGAAVETAMTGEVHTPFYCLHPFYGFVCRPNAVLDFSDTVPEWFGHRAIANIGPDGFRNLDRLSGKPSDEVWIALVGGSVAFSPASTNNAATISGYLERELNARSSVARRRRVRVWNLALPAAQQPQQAVILLNHKTELDGVISFDGVNEAVIGPYFNKRQIPDHFPFLPIYEVLYGRAVTAEQTALAWAIEETETWGSRSPRLARFVVEKIADRRIAGLRRRLRGCETPTPFASVFPRDAGAGLDEWVDAGARRWSEMIVSMNAMAGASRIDRTFALQPVPERDKPLTPDEQRGLEAYPDMVDLRQRAYPRLSDAADKLASEGIDCIQLGKAFAGVTESIYTDHVHFEDRGCEMVAKQLAAHVQSRWKSLQDRIS
jgi:hypothetical protein